MTTKLELYIKEIDTFLKDSYKATEDDSIGYNIITKEVGKVRLLPSLSDYSRPFKYTMFIKFDEAEKAKEYFDCSNNGKYNFHALPTVKEVKRILVSIFGNLTIV